MGWYNFHNRFCRTAYQIRRLIPKVIGVTITLLPAAAVAQDCATRTTVSFVLEDIALLDHQTGQPVQTISRTDDLAINELGYVQDCRHGAALMTHEVYDYVLVPISKVVFSDPILGVPLSGLTVKRDAAGSGFLD